MKCFSNDRYVQSVTLGIETGSETRNAKPESDISKEVDNSAENKFAEACHVVLKNKENFQIVATTNT